jgi:diacylglycerol kinase family enzyme
LAVAVREIGDSTDGSQLVRDAIESQSDLIIVCGGDGTINHVVRGMVHTRVPLAILPGGTANMLARELGLPLDVVAAARTIPLSTPQRLSLGSANGRLFLSVAGIGFDARVVQKLNGHSKKWLGMMSYILEGARQLFFGPPAPLFAISTNGVRHTATFACASRAQHYGPVRAIPEADLFSDQFHVYCFHSRSRLRYLHYATALLTGQQAGLPDFSSFPARTLRCEPLETNPPDILLQVDGELSGPLPCTIEIVPDAITLLVPPRV